MSAQQREQVDSLLEQLDSVGSQQQPRPLDNPLLYGNYNVAYTSTSRAQSERGQRMSVALHSFVLHLLLSFACCNRWAARCLIACRSLACTRQPEPGNCSPAKELVA
jgi:hypothetical protein